MTFYLCFAILAHIVIQKADGYAKNWILKIVFGFAINNGRGAKLISSAGHFGKAVSVRSERVLCRSFCRHRVLSALAGAWENILRTVTSVESYHWFKRSGGTPPSSQNIYLECYHESSSESIHGFFVTKIKPELFLERRNVYD